MKITVTFEVTDNFKKAFQKYIDKRAAETTGERQGHYLTSSTLAGITDFKLADTDDIREFLENITITNGERS